MQRLLFIFLDGVGIGNSSRKNPFYTTQSKFLPFHTDALKLPDGTPVKAIDPILGVEGIPQSASGQTTLYTGENIPALLNEHKGSYPDKLMRKMIKEKNILSRLRERNLKALFINVYPFYSRFFTNQHVRICDNGSFFFSEEFPKPFKRRISVTTSMLISNGVTPFDEMDILKKKAIYQDFSNDSINQRIEDLKDQKEINISVIDFQLPHFSPEEAAGILFKTFRKNNFTLYEYFQTDIYAHRRNFYDRVQLIKRLDSFIKRLLHHLNEAEDTLLITSDHGNLEDSTTLSHTLNPVPLLVWGKNSMFLRERINSIEDVTPAILDFFNGK